MNKESLQNMIIEIFTDAINDAFLDLDSENVPEDLVEKLVDFSDKMSAELNLIITCNR